MWQKTGHTQDKRFPSYCKNRTQKPRHNPPEDDKESKEPDYDYDDDNSDKEGEKKQEQETVQITINQVFDHCCHTFWFLAVVYLKEVYHSVIKL